MDKRIYVYIRVTVCILYQRQATTRYALPTTCVCLCVKRANHTNTHTKKIKQKKTFDVSLRLIHMSTPSILFDGFNCIHVLICFCYDVRYRCLLLCVQRKKKRKTRVRCAGSVFRVALFPFFSKRGNKQPYHNSKIKLVTSIDAVAQLSNFNRR